HDDAGTIVRPYFALGAQLFSSSSWTVNAAFEGAPAGVAPFAVSTRFPNALGRMAAGVEIQTLYGIDLKLEYANRFAGNYFRQSGPLASLAHSTRQPGPPSPDGFGACAMTGTVSVIWTRAAPPINRRRLVCSSFC